MSVHKPVISSRGLRRRSVPLGGYSPAPSGAPPVETYYLLKEDGDALLLEIGDHILKEDAP